MPLVRTIASGIIIVTLLAGNAVAQNRPNGSWEFAMLAGLSIYGHPSFRDGEAAVGAPVGASLRTVPISSAIRVTHWTNSPLTLEFGAGYVFEESSVLNGEIGIGANLRHRSAKLQPFVSGVVGVWLDWIEEYNYYIPGITYDEGTTGLYFGTAVGIKVFVRDHACWRLQTGIRKGGGRDETVLEVLTGLGFFL